MMKERSRLAAASTLSLLIIISSACSARSASTLPTTTPHMTAAVSTLTSTSTPTATSTSIPIPSPTSIGSLARSQIAFGSDLDGDFELYVMNVDGSGQTNLTKNPNRDYLPAWSPLLQNVSNQQPGRTTRWTRLSAGNQAKVTQDTPTPNRVRKSPSLADEVIAQLYPGSLVKLIEGLICTDGLIFWKLENASIPGGVGWTAESDGQEYWLEPYKPYVTKELI